MYSYSFSRATSAMELEFLLGSINQLMCKKGSIAPPYIDSFRKPLHIPSTQAFDIFHKNLEVFEVNCRNCIKTYVEQDKSPFKKCINRVS